MTQILENPTLDSLKTTVRTWEVPMRLAADHDLIHFCFQRNEFVYNYGMYFFLQNKQGHLECYALKHHGSVSSVKAAIKEGKAFLPITESIQTCVEGWASEHSFANNSKHTSDSFKRSFNP